MAIAEGPEALGPLERALPPDWAAAAIPSGMWNELDWSPLMGRRPIIVPENSQAGAAQAAKLEEYLRHIGIKCSILTLPAGLRDDWRIEDGLPGDVTMFFEPGNSYTEPLGTIFSALELRNRKFEELEWIVAGWLPVGLTFLVGASKIGKSWLAMDLATQIASGRPVFGSIRTQQADVLYMALEDGPRRIQSRMEKMLGGETLAPGLIFATEWQPFDKGGLAQLTGYLDNFPSFRVVIVDVLARVRGEPDGKRGVYQQDYKDIGELQRFATARNICLVLLHHTRKADASDALDRVSGSTGMVGAADTVLILSRPRGEEHGKLMVTGRDIIEDGEFALSFSKETAKWTLLGPAAQFKAETEQGNIYNLILASPEPMKPADIAGETGIGLGTVKVSLSRMKKRGSIHQVKYGLWGITGRDYDKPKKKDD